MDDRTTSVEQKITAGELKPTMRDYPRLFRFVLSRVFALSAVFLSFRIVGQLLTPLIALLWKGFVDGVVAMPAGAVIGRSVVLALAGYAALTLVRRMLANMTEIRGEFAFMLDQVQSNRFAELILSRMYAKVSRLPAEYFESSDFHDRSQRAFQYAGKKMRQEAVVGLYTLVAGMVGAVAVFVTLLAFHPMLSLIAVLAPLPTLYSRLIGAKITFRFKRDTSEDRRRLEYYEDLTKRSAIKELKALNAGAFVMGKWEKCAAGYLKAEMSTRLKTESIGLVGVVANNIAAAGSAVLAVWLLTRGEISLGALGAVFALSQSLTSSVGAVYGSIGNLISNRREVSQLFEFLDLPEERVDGASVSAQIDRIEAKGVHYRYPFSDAPVLRGVDFRLDRGDTVAFVGENGAGKSTFVKVLLGLLTPSEGELLIDGRAVTDLQPASYHDRLGAVFQDYGQYRGLTIADNVRLGDPAKDEPVDNALRMAGLQETPPDTMLGRDLDGTELSGGEWQKVAIARGLYRGRDILVLDEPTASLDPLAEEAVFRRFLQMAENRTTIVVTHRIGTAALARRVVVFHDGSIVEEGTHQELLALGGRYATMYAAQAEWYRR